MLCCSHSRIFTDVSLGCVGARSGPIKESNARRWGCRVLYHGATTETGEFVSRCWFVVTEV